jgi:ABC-type siderophore export system fused ATPase/permease subunit
MGNSREYLEQISKKLEAAEYAKRYREAQTRRYRRMMVAVFISGIVTGAAGIVLILLHPQWLFPSDIAIEAPLSFPMLPKMILLLIICFISVCITGLVRKVSDSREVRVR